MKSVVLGGGCFWCTEAAYQNLEGVEKATSGYAGGDTENPTYQEVCSGETGHAEVVKIQYREDRIGLEKLLELLFKIHDPTTEDREGPDVGSQYRSIILYNGDEQRQRVEAYIEQIRENYQNGIVTEVRPLKKFYSAEERHQDYFRKNPDDAYCRIHARPKVEKARKIR